MRTSLLKRITVFVLVSMIGAPSALFAQDSKNSGETKSAAPAAATAPKGKLSDEENRC